MNAFLEYLVKAMKGLDAGTLPDNPDPGDPSGIGGALNQDDINFIKRLRKEVEERFPEEEEPL